MEDGGKEILSVVGLADCCELMSVTFAFPTLEFAEALSSGAFYSDAQGCLEDSGVDSAKISKALESLDVFEGRAVANLFEDLRRGHTALYLAPGSEVPVFPYEAAFLFKAAGKKGIPTLFQTSTSLDVENQMRAAGVIPDDAQTEPVDSSWNELRFLSYLYGSLASATYEGRSDEQMCWNGRIGQFWNEHGRLWLPAFMNATKEAASKLSYGAEYAALAEVGSVVLEAVEANVSETQ